MKLAHALALLLACSLPAQASSPCHGTERSIWSCQAGHKRYALCASHDLGRATGYLQYRVEQQGKPEFQYPSAPVHPRGLFRLALLPRGATLSFSNAGYGYGIHEPLAGRTTIDVVKGEQGVAGIQCASSSDTLTLTSTLDFFKALGIHE